MGGWGEELETLYRQMQSRELSAEEVMQALSDWGPGAQRATMQQVQLLQQQGKLTKQHVQRLEQAVRRSDEAVVLPYMAYLQEGEAAVELWHKALVDQGTT